MTELIMKAYDVLDEIKSDQAYQRFLELDKLIKKTLENEVFEFDQKNRYIKKSWLLEVIIIQILRKYRRCF